MKKVFAIVIFCIVIPTISKAQEHAHEFWPIADSANSIFPPDTYADSALTDLDASLASRNYSRLMDSTLGLVYHAILKEHSSDTIFIKKFKRAEEAWIKYRDAELGAILPYDEYLKEPSPAIRYGNYVCQDEFRTALTKRRIEELMMWYKGHSAFCDWGSFKYGQENK